MTESTTEPLPPARVTAHLLADQLADYIEARGIPATQTAHISPSQKALMADSLGLLNGIGFGMITVSQPRVQQNLLQVIGELSNAPATEGSAHLIDGLTKILSQSSSAGLTAENQSLVKRLSERSR